MASMNSASVSAIQVSCKQTRFHIESPNYRELDIEGLNIVVTASPPSGTTKTKGKAASRSTGLEILSDATLRLKAGQRYALIGQNGTGKSTILRSIAEKLIPGIPEEARISVLQQTNANNDGADATSNRRTVLEEVLERATAKDELEQEIQTLTQGIDATAADDDGSDAYAALRALRKVRHDRLQKRLFVLDKNARLRSGARGMQARKALTALEKTVAEATVSWQEEDTDIAAEVLQAETQEAADMLAELQIQAEPARLAHIESRAKSILGGLGFSETMVATKPVGDLSGGWRMRTALAAALLSDADILLLDEPTNFLDMLGIVWLQKFLLANSEGAAGDDTTSGGEPARPPPTLILVSHDRDFVSAATDHLILLQDKALTYYTGDLPSYEAAQAESRHHLHKLKDAQDRQRAHLQETIARNMREGKKNNDDTRIRQAKMRQKKLDDRWGLETNANGHRFKLNRDMPGFHHTRRAEIEIAPEARAMNIVLPNPPDLRFPGALISLEGVCFRYGTAKKTPSPPPPWTLDTIDLNVHMGDRIGIVGLNGAGKSTLIRLLVGDDATTASGQTQSSPRPTKGTVTMHPRLRLAYYAQDAVDTIRALDNGSTTNEDGTPLTALSLLTRDVEGKLSEGDLRALLGELGLPGRLASDTPLRRLSGGQLVRCALARLLWQRPQCLVLDEVTTHLDYETSTALRRALRSWPGAVVLVSHDRWFMRGAIEGNIDDEIGSGLDDDGNESDLDDGAGGNGGGPSGRKLVYRLRAGKLTLLEGGVQQFEDQLEKRVKKLLAL
ncbi:hypothetical protein SBRCBS47491_006497 [Sporothrix bragantina]|uniref:ABC transporter domain-containing protein n=1 Tax=Sporothrix bragantina TaxID=671064 RepID=A0ABP0C5G2_9PEZI